MDKLFTQFSQSVISSLKKNGICYKGSFLKAKGERKTLPQKERKYINHAKIF